jgi:hypothetical protein
MTKDIFFASVFELATLWVEDNVDEEAADGGGKFGQMRNNYVEFLTGLFNIVSIPGTYIRARTVSALCTVQYSTVHGSFGRWL